MVNTTYSDRTAKPAPTETQPDPERVLPDTIQQVECPVAAPGSLEKPIKIPEHLRFIVHKTIPHTLGYMATNFSGLGRNDAKEFTEQIGVTGDYKDSRRVFGANYFVPTTATCSGNNSGCDGQPQHYYMRNYPVTPMKGNLSFAILDDLIDLNPMSLIRAMFGSATGMNTCVSATLPVGTNLDDPTLRRQSYADYMAKRAACQRKCNKDLPEADKPHANYDCRQTCDLGWWEATACMVPPAATES